MPLGAGQAAHQAAIEAYGQHVGHTVGGRAWPHILKMADQRGADLVEIPQYGGLVRQKLHHAAQLAAVEQLPV